MTQANKQSGVRSTCPYCGVGCGIVASFDTEGRPQIQGDSEHPANYGKLCSKGSDLAQTFLAPHRLLQPRIQGQTVSWDEANQRIADTFTDCIEQHGPESVAFYVSGQLLTEDYYVANKFVKGWLGTANIDTNSRLCMASSVTGHKRAFGADTVPGCYEDLEQADLVVMVGSNLAWCHPVLYQRIAAARHQRPTMKLVVIDPRRSATADEADLHLAIRPDADALLFNALLVHLAEAGAIDHSYIDQYVTGFDEALNEARQSTAHDLCARLGIDSTVLDQFLDLVTATEKTVTVYSQGVNQSSCGTDKVNAIINTHLATARIGRPGMGPFSITGQPNAMGGREVGGLATMLACHMDLVNPNHQQYVQTFWNSPAIATQQGLTAVSMFDAVAKGQIKALWVMATNPIDSLPDADHIKRAMRQCPFVIVSEVTSASDTVQYADVALPAQPFGEKDGTVTNSERRISRQRRIVPPSGEAMPNWWAICEVARRMGFAEAFAYQKPADIFREYASLSGYENNGTRDFDISAYADVSDVEYERLQPFQWPSASGEDKPASPIRFFAKGQFYTADKKGRMLPIKPPDNDNALTISKTTLTLNTGRIRDQWHTMTRTGYSARLMSHLAEPFVEIHPDDARQRGIATADIVKVESPLGHVLLRASLSDRQRRSEIFVPMHWNDQFASRARIDSVLDSLIDPYSHQPASKNQPVHVSRFQANSYAFVLSKMPMTLSSHHGMEYWARAPSASGWQMELAGSASARVMLETLISSLPLSDELNQAESQQPDIHSIEYSDESTHEHRVAFFSGSELIAMVFVAAEPVAVSRSWAAQQLEPEHASMAARWQLLAGRPPADQPDKGAIVCSCMMVGEKDIERAVVDSGCQSVNAVGQCNSAGTNCGSCRNDIQRIIDRHPQLELPASEVA